MKDLSFFTRHIISDDLGIDVSKRYHADKVKDEIEKYYSEKTIENVQREITKIEISPMNVVDYAVNWFFIILQIYVALMGVIITCLPSDNDLYNLIWKENSKITMIIISAILIASVSILVMQHYYKRKEKYYEYKLKCLYEILDNKKKNENVKNVKVRTLRNRRINIR